jgi:hypothetical protein
MFYTALLNPIWTFPSTSEDTRSTNTTMLAESVNELEHSPTLLPLDFLDSRKEVHRESQFKATIAEISWKLGETIAQAATAPNAWFINSELSLQVPSPHATTAARATNSIPITGADWLTFAGAG